MPSLVKLAEIRYRALDKCFSDRTRYYYLEDLVRIVNEALERHGEKTIAQRTVEIAINDMRTSPEVESCIPVRKRNGRHYYRYEDPTYSYFQRDLNEHQLTQLKSLLLMLQQFRGLPQFEQIEELKKNIEEHYQFELRDTKEIISFDTNQYVKGLEHLSILFESIVNQQALSILYHPYERDAYVRMVHPYFIKQYNGRWFLFGYDDQWKQLSNLPLDRIERVELANIAYIPNEEYDIEEYFDDVIGVTRDLKEERKQENRGDDVVKHVVLQFYNNRLPYVISKPMHGSQRLSKKFEDSIEIDIIPNNEFYQQLLSFGGDVKVLEPKEVSEKMANEAKKIYNLYKK